MIEGRRGAPPSPRVGWYGPHLGAQPRGPQIADSICDLKKINNKVPKQAQTSRISPTRGPKPQRGRGRGPHEPRKASKTYAKYKQKLTKSAPRGPTTTEGAKARPPPAPKNKQKYEKYNRK